MDAWFPRINARGDIASGSTEIWLRVAGGESRKIVDVGGGPLWLTSDSVIYNDRAEPVAHQALWPGPWPGALPTAYNDAATNEEGRWAGFAAIGEGRLDLYDGARLIESKPAACAPKFDGQSFGYLTPYQSEQRDLIVDGQRVHSGPIVDYALGPPAPIVVFATGMYTRQFHNALIINPSEGGLRYSDGWLCTNAGNANGLYVRPFNSYMGYFLPGDQWFYHDFRKFGGVLVVAASTARGEPNYQTLRTTDPMVDLRTANAPPPIIITPPPPTGSAMQVPNKAAELDTFWTEYNGHVPITDDAQKHIFTANFASHLASTDPRFGRKSRIGNAPISKDTLAYWLGDPLPTTPTDGKIDAVDIINSSGQVGWDTRAERGDPAYRNIDGRWFPAAAIVQPPPPPPPNVHQYDGGEHDTDVCDICHLSRFDPVHVTAESKVKHAYNGGEQDTGLCDICQKAASDPIHDLSPQPPPGGGGTGVETGGLDVEVLALLGQILDSCHAQEERQGETIAAIQELREAVTAAGKNLTGELVKAAPGILAVLLPFLKKAPKPAAKRKRR